MQPLLDALRGAFRNHGALLLKNPASSGLLATGMAVEVAAAALYHKICEAIDQGATVHLVSKNYGADPVHLNTYGDRFATTWMFYSNEHNALLCSQAISIAAAEAIST